MKVIIAGGRDYRLTDEDREYLDGLGITEVIHGAHWEGVDLDAKRWAIARLGWHTPFPAIWEKHGLQAGPIRNRRMAEYLAAQAGPVAVVLFPGGGGTASMRREAERAELPILEPHAKQAVLIVDDLQADHKMTEADRERLKRHLKNWDAPKGTMLPFRDDELVEAILSLPVGAEGDEGDEP